MQTHPYKSLPLFLIIRSMVLVLLIATTLMFSWESISQLDFIHKKELTEKKAGFTEDENEKPTEKQADEKNDVFSDDKECMKIYSPNNSHNAENKILNGFYIFNCIPWVHYELISPPPDC